jgi:hypothetical protein
MSELVLTLDGNRPWSDEEETTACKVEIKDGMTSSEFLYRLQDMFVVVLEQENARIKESETK